jgi:hypothetical protein
MDDVIKYVNAPGKYVCFIGIRYRGADKSLARPGRKQATATEDFDFHVSYFIIMGAWGSVVVKALCY